MAALTFDDIPFEQQQPSPAPPRGPLTFDHIPMEPAPGAAPTPPAAPAAPLAAAAGATGPIGDQRPWYAQAGQAADDLARLAAGGLTFGFADKLAGWAGGEGTEAERAKTEAARQRLGWYGTAAEFGSGLVGPLGVQRAGLSLVGNIPRALSNIGTRAGAAAVEGAGLGALSAAGHDEDIGQGAKVGAIGGALLQPAGEALAGAVGGAAGLFNRRPPVPTAEELKAASGAAYRAADQAGVIVKPSFTQDLSTRITSALANEGYTPNLHSGVSGVLNEINANLGQNVTLKGLENIRRIASDLRGSNDPASARLGGVMTREIDSALDSMNLGHLLSGNKTEGLRALQDARGLWRQGRKADIVEGALRAAQDQAASSGVGGNVENAIRQQFKSVLRSPQSRFLTGDEREALRNVVQGDTFANMMRHLGRFAPNAGWLQAITNVGAIGPTGGLSLAGSAAAMGAKAVAEKAAMNRIYGLARVIANGGTAPPPIQNAVQRLSQAERDTLANILRTWGVTAGVTGGAAAALP